MAASLAEALAECKARNLGPSACSDIVDPFCGGRGVEIIAGSPPIVRCVAGEDSARKAAIQLAEAQAKIAASKGSPWLLIGGGVAALALVVYLATR
jgi:hypothetical protein